MKVFRFKTDYFCGLCLTFSITKFENNINLLSISGIPLLAILGSGIIAVKLLEIYHRKREAQVSSTQQEVTNAPEFAKVTPYNLRVLRGEVPVMEQELEVGDIEETAYEALNKGWLFALVPMFKYLYTSVIMV